MNRKIISLLLIVIMLFTVVGTATGQRASASAEVTVHSIKIEFNKTPIILVHGWHGSPETWSSGSVNLVQELNNRGYVKDRDYFVFDYAPGTGSPTTYAYELQSFINEQKTILHYNGKFTIVCHSMGALVTRWYMEQLGGDKNIAQWIGIAPVSHGAAIADKVPDLLLWAVPSLGKEAVQQMRTDSTTVSTLDGGHIAPGVTYRVIMGNNANHDPHFGFWFFGRKTLAKKIDEKHEAYYYSTHLGDGIVANEQSWISGAGIDTYIGLNHNALVHDKGVLDRVIDYIEHPERPVVNTLMPNDPEDRHSVSVTGNRGIVTKGSPKEIKVSIDLADSATFALGYRGSKLALTVTSPSGVVMRDGRYPVVEHWETTNSIGYEIDAPEPGNWTARIDPIDVPDAGEPYVFTVLCSSNFMSKLPITPKLSAAVTPATVTTGQTFTINGTLTNAKNGALISGQEDNSLLRRSPICGIREPELLLIQRPTTRELK